MTVSRSLGSELGVFYASVAEAMLCVSHFCLYEGYECVYEYVKVCVCARQHQDEAVGSDHLEEGE